MHWLSSKICLLTPVNLHTATTLYGRHYVWVMSYLNGMEVWPYFNCTQCIVVCALCVMSWCRWCAIVSYRELETSSLVCDCRLEWFVNWMSASHRSSRLRVSELAVCGLPTALKGTLLKELTVEDLHCGECCVVFTVQCTTVQSAVLLSLVVCLSACLSVCPSVTLVDHDHIGWKSWKLIARTISQTSCSS